MALAWIPALWVKAQKPVMGLLNGVLTWTASATISSIWDTSAASRLGVGGRCNLPP